MKKQKTIIIFGIILLGLAFGIYQYSAIFKTEIASATSTVPNPGHTWASMECNSDSLCITNNKLGIGTSSPSSVLQIQKSSSDTGIPTTSPTDNKYRLLISNPQLTSDATYAIGFSSYQGSATAYIASSTYYDGYFKSNLSFGTRDDAAGGLAESLRINYNGNVGIGTTSPALKLEVKSTADAQLRLSSPDIWAGINFTDSNGSGYIWYYGASNGGTGNWAFGGGGSVANNRISVSGNMAIGSSFQSSSAPANGLIVEGAVGIGTASPSYTLTVAGTAWVTSGSWSGSDIRWKKNIETLSQSSSLEKVMALNPVNYQWRTDEFPDMKFQTGTQLGFIAQDVEKIIPEVVTTNNEGYKGISYEKIVPVLTSAIQEQEKKIEQLKALVCQDHPLEEVCK